MPGGAGTVFTKQAWTFLRAVYIGDTIRAEAFVVSVHPRRPMADLAFVVKKQDDDEWLTGEVTVFQATPEER